MQEAVQEVREWPRLKDLKAALDDFNRLYPRPGLPPREMSKKYRLDRHFSYAYPNGELPGVYAIFASDGELVRLGKASCNNTLNNRLPDYFPADKNASEWKAVSKYEGYDDEMYIYTIGFPPERAFEAPALEEYLIRRLRPRFNTNGAGAKKTP